MAYGIQVFDEAGIELKSAIQPVFYLDYITGPASGSRSYNLAPGKGLAGVVNNYFSTNQTTVTPMTYSVSGNSISWSGVSDEQPLLVVQQ